MARQASRLKLGFLPLPAAEALRLRSQLAPPIGEHHSAIDPCVGDGTAFCQLTDSSINGAKVYRYGIEIDAYRADQAAAAGINVLCANTMDVHCPVDSASLLFLNPPYDFEVGHRDNLRLELVFLRHTGRWIRPGGVLVFVIPQSQLKTCARTLAEHFMRISVYRLSDPECVKYKQIALLAVRRKRSDRPRDSELSASMRYLEDLAMAVTLPVLGDTAEGRYEVPPSGPIVLTNSGLPLDQIEDAVVDSSAYRQIRRLLVRETNTTGGRPPTPLHGGHVVPIGNVVNC